MLGVNMIQPFSINQVQVFDELPDTNSHLKKMLNEKGLDEGTIFRAEYQTSGRGQFGNSWQAEKGKNLLMSLLLKPNRLNADQLFLINMSVCLTLLKTLKQYHPNFMIKWPNDIIWNTKKIAGILIENNLSSSKVESCIAGIGVNINQNHFNGNIKATSLKNIIGKDVGLESFLEQLIDQMNQHYYKLFKTPKELKKEYYQHLYAYQNSVHIRVNETNYLGKITSVDDSGTVHMLLNESLPREFQFKEVQFVL